MPFNIATVFCSAIVVLCFNCDVCASQMELMCKWACLGLQPYYNFQFVLQQWVKMNAHIFSLLDVSLQFRLEAPFVPAYLYCKTAELDWPLIWFSVETVRSFQNKQAQIISVLLSLWLQVMQRIGSTSMWLYSQNSWIDCILFPLLVLKINSLEEEAYLICVKPAAKRLVEIPVPNNSRFGCLNFHSCIWKIKELAGCAKLCIHPDKYVLGILWLWKYLFCVQIKAHVTLCMTASKIGPVLSHLCLIQDWKTTQSQAKVWVGMF